jgi:ATP-dependent RNA helicase DeaD
VLIKSKTTTASKIRQRFWMVAGVHKLDALTRILEAEPFDAMLVFTRTKLATEELAEKLGARGFAVEALNGDIQQAQRERTIARLKGGQIDIVVATDVAARGLDVERVSHVVNYDAPHDPESYVHRIGRTGRAGRSGEAIIFIAPRERNLLRLIERTTRQSIAAMQLPTPDDVNTRRIERFNLQITNALSSGAAEKFRPLIERYEQTHNTPALDIAAALASIARGGKALLMDIDKAPPSAPTPAHPARPERAARGTRDHPAATEPGTLATYRMEVGHAHGARPGNIVGAIANEAGLSGPQLGRVVIRDDHSYIDLPADLPKEILRKLQKTRVAGQRLDISRALKTQVEKLQRERPTKGSRVGHPGRPQRKG